MRAKSKTRKTPIDCPYFRALAFPPVGPVLPPVNRLSLSKRRPHASSSLPRPHRSRHRSPPLRRPRRKGPGGQVRIPRRLHQGPQGRLEKKEVVVIDVNGTDTY